MSSANQIPRRNVGVKLASESLLLSSNEVPRRVNQYFEKEQLNILDCHWRTTEAAHEFTVKSILDSWISLSISVILKVLYPLVEATTLEIG
jgi:hypothetical protein